MHKLINENIEFLGFCLGTLAYKQESISENLITLHSQADCSVYLTFVENA